MTPLNMLDASAWAALAMMGNWAAWRTLYPHRSDSEGTRVFLAFVAMAFFCLCGIRVILAMGDGVMR